MDTYAEDSIQMLKRSGLQFNRHHRDGIDPKDFSVLLITSGAVMMDNVKFLSFHRYARATELEKVKRFVSRLFQKNVVALIEVGCFHGDHGKRRNVF